MGRCLRQMMLATVFILLQCVHYFQEDEGFGWLLCRKAKERADCHDTIRRKSQLHIFGYRSSMTVMWCVCWVRWNQLDLAIVLLSVAGIILEEMDTGFIPINPTIIRVMRVLRIARGSDRLSQSQFLFTLSMLCAAFLCFSFLSVCNSSLVSCKSRSLSIERLTSLLLPIIRPNWTSTTVLLHE